jgi:hypothetical protein
MYSTPVAGYWMEMGWGESAVGPNGVVHHAYTAGAAGDPGNIFYVRSTDAGLTWSAPLKLNTDATTRGQWGASLSVNTAGTVFVSWYDERNTATDALERFGRASTDNGLTWGADMAISDGVFPKPLQPDPAMPSTFVGTYHRSAFSEDGTGSVAYHAWTDGRILIAGAPQQDVFFDKISFGAPTVISAVSRKTHGAAGTFDVGLPLVPIGDAIGVECRSGAVAGEHQIVVTFATPVTMSGASISTGIGTIANTSVVGAVVTVNLTGVSDVQRLGVTLADVSNGATTGSVMIPIGLLRGDANGDRIVNSGDTLQTRSRSGLPLDATNFRSDMNTDGNFNSGDTLVVRSRSGTSLP